MWFSWKRSVCNEGELGWISGLGAPWGGKGYPLQYSGLENSMDYTVHGVAKSWTRLKDFHFHFTHTEQKGNKAWLPRKMEGLTRNRICLFHVSCHIYWHKVVHNIFYYLIVRRICSDITSPTPWCWLFVSPFFFPLIILLEVCKFHVSSPKNKTAFDFIDFFPYCFVFFILLISALVFYYFLFLINLDLICCFLIFLTWKLRSLMWDFTSFSV